MEIITGGVTAAKGFMAAGVEAGIKYQNRKDMAMIYSEVPCKAAGTFTTNIVKAAPVKWDHNVVYNSKAAQAVVINAGIANACTGEEGMGYCRQTAEKVEKVLGIAADEVLVASTGVIGMQLPIDRICNGIDAMVPLLKGDTGSGTEASKAIMTTDTKNKEVAVTIKIGGKTVTITATAKDGSGKKASYKIYVKKGIVKKVYISGVKSVKAGKKLYLKGKTSASSGANRTLKWSSSNTKYAKVSSKGTVTTYKAGKKKSVKITARAVDGSGKSKTVTIKIK